MTKRTNPTDQLIRDLLVRERTANEEEIAAIIARLASAPFNDQLVSYGIRLIPYANAPPATSKAASP